MARAAEPMATATTLDAALRQLVRDVVLEVVPAIVRAELAARGDQPAVAQQWVARALLTAREAAEAARVSEKTLRGWVRSGRLHAHHAGRQLRIDRGDLDRFLSDGGAGERVDVDALADDLLHRRRRGG